MCLSVTMPYSRKDVLERLKKFSVTSSTLYSLLNTCFADWMINPVPVITGEELLQLCLECYGKRAYNPFMESLISRMTEGGEYTNYDKFFELLENHAEESWAFFAVAKVGYSLHKAINSAGARYSIKERFLPISSMMLRNGVGIISRGIFQCIPNVRKS